MLIVQDRIFFLQRFVLINQRRSSMHLKILLTTEGGTARKAAIELAKRAVNEDRIYNTQPKISCYFTTEHADSDSLRSFLCERSEISDLQGIINRVANIEYEMN